MGFYGNITNTARTQFQFDKVYANRKAMDQSVNSDGVYFGRYVLVEYDNNGLDGMLRVYTENKTVFYSDSTMKVKLTQKNTQKDQIVYLYDDDQDEYEFYKCTSDFNSASNDPATFVFVVANKEAYTRNYNIDLSAYSSSGRGYDSTVWQKVYVNNESKYVMIAELNTVVPKFDIVADAPSTTPVAPHFDTQSTDVYYKLHMQAPWGFRVAPAAADQSDVRGPYVYYDSTSETEKQQTANLAIYFNKAGFEEYTPSENNGDNYIKMMPVSSGKRQYDDHDITTTDLVTAPDIQQLYIHLPAIGNVVSKAWDVIHGDDRKDSTGDAHPSLQGRLNAFGAMQDNTIAIKRSSDGTLVGTQINGNTNRTVSNVLNETLHVADYDKDDAWIKTSINTVGLDNSTDLKGIAIHHTFHATDDTTTTANKNDSAVGNGDNKGKGDTLKLYTPKVDAAGHVVGKNIETVTLPYGYKTIQIGQESSSVDDVTANANSIVADNTQGTMTFTPGNKWIHLGATIDTDVITVSHEVNSIVTNANDPTNLNTEADAVHEDNINIPDWAYDNAGHIISKQNHYYTLPFGFKTIAVDEKTDVITDMDAAAGDVVADSTQDTLTVASGNKWIHIAADVNNDNISFAHEVNAITTDAKSDTDLNDGTDTIVIQDTVYDEAGHVTANQQHTYTLPYGYKTISTNGTSTDEDDIEENSESTSAVNTQDTLNINIGNRWLKTKIEDGIITIAHARPGGTTATDVGDIGDMGDLEFGDSFTVPHFSYDGTGHISGYGIRNITIPVGSLDDSEESNDIANVLTNIAFTPSTGKIEVKHNNVGKLLLTGLEAINTNSDWIQASDSINGAFLKIDDRLDKEAQRATTTETNLDNRINDLNDRVDNLNCLDGSEAGKVVYSVSQSSGVVSTSYKNVGELLLNGYVLPTSVSNPSILATESLNTSLGKLEYKINSGIDAIAQEVTDRDAAIANAINGLNVSDEAVDNRYVSAVSETGGKISVTRATLPTYSLTSGSMNGTIAFNGSDVMVQGLNSAAYKPEEYFVSKEIYDRKIAELDAAIIGINQEAKRLTNENISLMNKITELIGRIETLEKKINEE